MTPPEKGSEKALAVAAKAVLDLACTNIAIDDDGATEFMCMLCGNSANSIDGIEHDEDLACFAVRKALARDAEDRAEVVQMLRAIQWQDRGGDEDVCALCERQESKHVDCRLSAILARLEGR